MLTEQKNSTMMESRKLSDVVNDDLQDILDRLDALRSDDNAYRSFRATRKTDRWTAM